jgi:hypothetical protein
VFVFQTLALLQDHLQYLPLQSGFIAELKMTGVVSFDSSGQIRLSLWNRNAHSLVEKKYVYSVGVAVKIMRRIRCLFIALNNFMND